MANQYEAWFVAILKDLATFSRNNGMKDVSDKLDEIILMEPKPFKTEESGRGNIKYFWN